MALSDVETSRTFPFEPGGPTRLELRWTASFRTIRVLLDGNLVGTLDRPKMPREGTELPLPDGSTLLVRLGGILGLELRRNGVHLPGSDLEPKRLLRHAAFLMIVAAVIDGATDGALLGRTRQVSVEAWESLPFWSRPHTMPLALDLGLLLFAIPTALGSRIALAIGVLLFASRFGVEKEHASWAVIYGVVTTWALATHLFATFKRPARRR